MKQNLLEKLTVSQLVRKIPNTLWNKNVHYRNHNSPPRVPIQSYINPVHAPTHYFRKINLTLTSHLRLGLPSGLFPSGFPTKTLYAPHL